MLKQKYLSGTTQQIILDIRMNFAFFMCFQMSVMTYFQVLKHARCYEAMGNVNVLLK